MRGLSKKDVDARLKQFGYNELPSSQPKNIWRIAVEVMKEPMFLLLISCGVLYMLIGDYREGMILLSAIFVIIFITFYQYRKTERALEALKNLSSPRAMVFRNGVEVRIPGREVVPDDVLILNEGDRVPADASVLDSTNLTVDESILTGESVAVRKTSEGKTSEESNHRIFSGTLVVQGRGYAAVTETGIHTRFGEIGLSLKNIEEDQTRLQKEMKIFIRNLAIIGIFISVAVVIFFYLGRGNFIQSLLTGLSSSMAILPEEFPVVLTVFLALGAWRLSKKNVLTRKPSAIETLGSATVLCADKTGTITQNKMEVAGVFNGNEIFYRETFHSQAEKITSVLEHAHQASSKDSIDPMEKAIRKVWEDHGNKNEKALIKEFAISADLLAMTRIVSDSTNKLTASAKGAPEAIFKLCHFNDETYRKQISVVQQMAEKGFRVIAVAFAELSATDLPQHQQDITFTLVGMIGLEDPIRPEVPQAIKECNEAGIKVMMITGDYPITARNIARQIGLHNADTILTGEELKNLSDEALKEKLKHTGIIARVAPEQKLRIVQALKANGEVVAMTGDGVNDAPALKAAHIGVAMGNKGTDVAREASSLVLLDDNFASIVSAMRLGRRIFDNLQKAMSYILAIHIPIIGLTLLPALFADLPILLLPLHIVFMELIIDPVCSVAFESEQEEKGIMSRAPRKTTELFFGSRNILFSVMQGLLTLTMVLIVYVISINEGHSDGEVRAITFSSLIIGNVCLILTNLSKTRSFLQVFTEKNLPVKLIIAVALFILLLVISTPALQVTFSFEFPGYAHFIASIIGAVLLLVVLEAIKFFKSKRAVISKS